jgi:hypothetical protein
MGLEVSAHQIRQRWLSQGVPTSQVTPDDLAAIRTAFRAEIPADYESFLEIAGSQDGHDKDQYRFWHPREIRPTSDVLRDAGYPSNATELSIVIADYMQESWWFSLWLTGPWAGQVSLALGLCDGSDPQPPIASFDDFLELYMRDDGRLYPPDET